MTSKLRVLITGGAGFVGVNLARHLLDLGCAVTILDLERPQPGDGLDGVPLVQGDIRDGSLLRRSLGGTDVVVHAAAALPLWDPAQIRSINEDGTSCVMDACRELGIPRVVNISSTAIYGVANRRDIRETDPLLGKDTYSQSKIRAEEIANRYRDRVIVTHLRAKLVTGPGRLGIFSVVFDWVRRGKSVPIIGRGRNTYQMLHVEDLSRAVWSAAGAPAEAANDAYNIAAGSYGTLRKDFEDLLAHAGFGRRVVPLPEGPLVALLRVLDRLKMSPLSQDIIQAAGKDSAVSIEKAAARLGWVPRHSNAKALIDAYEWFLQHPEAGGAGSGVTHRRPLKQGILALVRSFF